MWLPDPLGAAPYKVTPGAEETLRTFQRTHGWPISIVPMEEHHARTWEREVRSTVERIEVERLTGIRDSAPRADAYWLPWSTIWRVHSVAARMGMPLPTTGGAHRVPALTNPGLFAVEVIAQDRRPVPAGMMLAVGRHRFPNARSADARGPQGERCTFVWLVAVAPVDTLQAWGIPATLQLGRVVVDTAIQASVASGGSGYVLLHADPKGGAALARFYEDCMMLKVDPTHYPSISSNRPNDGRYYYFDLERADQFSATLHPWRYSSLNDRPINPFGPVRVAS